MGKPSEDEIYTKTVPLKGQGNGVSPYQPDEIDSSVYSWIITDWIGNYNVVKIEYWIETVDEFTIETGEDILV